MKKKQQQWKAKQPGKASPRPEEPGHSQPKKIHVSPEPEKPATEYPFRWFPAIGEGKPGCIYISYIVVYYSLN